MASASSTELPPMNRLLKKYRLNPVSLPPPPSMAARKNTERKLSSVGVKANFPTSSASCRVLNEVRMMYSTGKK